MEIATDDPPSFLAMLPRHQMLSHLLPAIPTKSAFQMLEDYGLRRRTYFIYN